MATFGSVLGKFEFIHVLAGTLGQLGTGIQLKTIMFIMF